MWRQFKFSNRASKAEARALAKTSLALLEIRGADLINPVNNIHGTVAVESQRHSAKLLS